MKITGSKYIVIRVTYVLFLSILCTSIYSQNQNFKSFKLSICKDTFITHYGYSGLAFLNPGLTGVNRVFDISLMPIQKTDSAVYELESDQSKNILQLKRKTFSNDKIEKYQLCDKAFSWCGVEKDNGKCKSNLLVFPLKYGSFETIKKYDTLFVSSSQLILKLSIDSIWIDAEGTLVKFHEQFPVLRQKTINRTKILKYHLQNGSWISNIIKEQIPYIVYRYWNEFYAEPISQLLCSYEGNVLYATYNAPRTIANR